MELLLILDSQAIPDLVLADTRAILEKRLSDRQGTRAILGTQLMRMAHGTVQLHIIRVHWLLITHQRGFLL